MLFGREHECARLEELLDDARNGHSRALVLRGDPGIGKTALLEYAIERAEGFRVLRAVGIESESKLAFSGLHQLLRPVLGALDQVPEAGAEALRRSLALAEPGEVNPFLVYAGALQLLAAAAEREPILAVVDDAHWLDPASAEAITFAARRLEAESVAVLFAVREGETTRLDARGIPELWIKGLSAEAAGELLAEVDGGSIAAAVAGRLVAATEGNPLALVEIPPMLSEGQRAGTDPLDDPLAVGESVERAFLSRARSLSPRAREALLIAAASDSGDLAAIARACGGSVAALDEAEEAGLVRVHGGELSFRHPLVRSAVYAAASAGARREAHAALAEAFGEEDADRRAWHLAAAAIGPDEAIAAALEGAAERARGRGGVGAEARLLERSAALTPTRTTALLASAKLAGPPSSAGWSDESLALLERGLQLVEDPLTRADLHDSLAYVFWSRASPAGVHSETLRRRGRERGGEGPGSSREASLARNGRSSALRFDVDRSASSPSGPGRWWKAAMKNRSRTPSPPEPGTPCPRVICLRGSLSARRGAAIVEANEELSGGALLLDFADCLTGLEQYRLAAQLLEEALPFYRERGMVGDPDCSLERSFQPRARRGRFDRAAAAGTEAVQRATELDLARQLSWALATLAAVEAVLGRERECHAHSEEAIAAARESVDREIEAHAHDALGRLELGTGRAQESITHLERVRELAGRARWWDCVLAVAAGSDRGIRSHQAPLRRGGRAGGFRELQGHRPRTVGNRGDRSLPRAARGRGNLRRRLRRGAQAAAPTTSRRSSAPAPSSSTASACAGPVGGSTPANSCAPPSISSSASVPPRGQSARARSCAPAERRRASAIRRLSTSSPRASSRSRSR